MADELANKIEKAKQQQNKLSHVCGFVFHSCTFHLTDGHRVKATPAATVEESDASEEALAKEERQGEWIR